MTEKKTNFFSFEEAYTRLETILEELNSKELSLDKSLILYEEADNLISHCSQKLSSAEQKIQMLMKNRKGEIVMHDKTQPKLEGFPHETSDETSC